MDTPHRLSWSRREFGKLALAGLPLSLALARADSKIHGVRIGLQSYSFRDMPLDAAIKAMADIGLGECELYSGHVEPKSPSDESSTSGSTAAGGTAASGASATGGGAGPAGSARREGQRRRRGRGGSNPAAREETRKRKWRLSTPLDYFTAVRKQFDAAGVKLQAYNLSFNDSFTDEEIDRGFEMATALGVSFITASSTLSAAKRVAPFAEKHKMRVAMHNHSNVKDPNEFATPESFAAALAMSPYFAVNLDIGHFTAANYDAIAFIEANRARITNLHLKDRKKNQGENVPWGQGDTPIKAVLQLLKQKKYDIAANIEYEYKGEDTVAEVRKCFQFCKDALA